MQAVENILVPIDFSHNADTIFNAALFMARTFRAKLNIVFVLHNFDEYSGCFGMTPINQRNLEEELYASAQQRMDEFITEHQPLCDEAGIPKVSAKVLTGDVAEEVVKYAKQKGIQLIVMGTHGYKGFERIMFGSVAEKLVKTAPCPVLILNPYRDRGEVKA